MAAAYPSFEEAVSQGRTFRTVNERKKVQITDAKVFPEAVRKLNAALASPAFLSDLSFITGIPNLLADEQLVGGGMHITGAGGRLDVHVDFNYIDDRKLHRRLNLLLYLNPLWEDTWGGHLQLWDRGVKRCTHAFAPALNRCLIFATNNTSLHGVVPVSDDTPVTRRSFAAYYYTREAPPNWEGAIPSTIFHARPEEWARRRILMPAETVQRWLAAGTKRIKREAKRFLVGAR